MTEQQHVTYVAPAPALPRNTLAIPAMILGICGAALSIIPFLGLFLGGVPAILGVVLGLMGLDRAAKLPGKVGVGPSSAGLALGVLGLYVVAKMLWG